MRNVLIIGTALAAILIIGGCTTTGTDTGTTTTTVLGTTTSTAIVPGNALVGTWVGTWEDLAYHVGGPISATITQNGSTLTGVGTIDLSAIGLGQETGTASGTIIDSSVLFTFNSTTVGSGGGTVASTSIVGTGEVTGVLNFGNFTFAGTMDAGGTTLTGQFGFTTGGYGVASATKQ